MDGNENSQEKNLSVGAQAAKDLAEKNKAEKVLADKKDAEAKEKKALDDAKAVKEAEAAKVEADEKAAKDLAEKNKAETAIEQTLSEIIKANSSPTLKPLLYWITPTHSPSLGLMSGEATKKQVETFLKEAVKGVDLAKWLSAVDPAKERETKAKARMKERLGLK